MGKTPPATRGPRRLYKAIMTQVTGSTCLLCLAAPMQRSRGRSILVLRQKRGGLCSCSSPCRALTHPPHAILTGGRFCLLPQGKKKAPHQRREAGCAWAIGLGVTAGGNGCARPAPFPSWAGGRERERAGRQQGWGHPWPSRHREGSRLCPKEGGH